jgi:hypothetical protein
MIARVSHRIEFARKDKPLVGKSAGLDDAPVKR